MLIIFMLTIFMLIILLHGFYSLVYYTCKVMFESLLYSLHALSAEVGIDEFLVLMCGNFQLYYNILQLQISWERGQSREKGTNTHYDSEGY